MQNNGALQGIKVLDLSRMLPGPYCSMILADHGAEVIAVEDRRFKADGLFLNTVNRNKKHMTLNLKTEAGLEIFFRLAGEADVLLEAGEGIGTVHQQLDLLCEPIGGNVAGDAIDLVSVLVQDQEGGVTVHAETLLQLRPLRIGLRVEPEPHEARTQLLDNLGILECFILHLAAVRAPVGVQEGEHLPVA